MDALPVNEIFATIQGEGAWTGTPSMFIRLQGCPVGCPWCDTKYTWALDPKMETAFNEVDFTIAAESGVYARATVANLHKAACAWRCGGKSHHIVITGGEPALYDLRPLSECLLDDAFSVQLETSGTHEINIDGRAYVTVSPKVGMPGGFDVLGSALMRADEIKHPVGKWRDVEQLKALLADLPRWHRPPVFLQPLSESAKATELAIIAATDNGWRVSIQTHKVLGVR